MRFLLITLYKSSIHTHPFLGISGNLRTLIRTTILEIIFILYELLEILWKHTEWRLGRESITRLVHLPFCNLLSIIICLTHTDIWESIGKPCSCIQFLKSRIFCYKSHENLYQCYKSRENPYQYYKSCENPYQILQVMWAAFGCAMKLNVMIKSS